MLGVYIICLREARFGFGMNLTAYLDLGIMDWELLHGLLQTENVDG